jgi:hypothetical protein
MDHTGLEGHGVARGHAGLGHGHFERRRLGKGLYAYGADCGWAYSGYCDPNCYPHRCYGY